MTDSGGQRQLAMKASIEDQLYHLDLLRLLQVNSSQAPASVSGAIQRLLSTPDMSRVKPVRTFSGLAVSCIPEAVTSRFTGRGGSSFLRFLIDWSSQKRLLELHQFWFVLIEPTQHKSVTHTQRGGGAERCRDDGRHRAC